jgi:hypothetical protein
MMINLPGKPNSRGQRIPRRRFLQVGGLGLYGLTQSDLLRSVAAETTSADPSSRGDPSRGLGRAKRVIVLYLYGAPSQMDTLDPKPDAPVETRGEFGTISTSLPGITICEHLPRIAQVMHRTTLIRSMTHPYNNHAVAYTLSGIPISEPAIEANAREPRHWPYVGSVLEYLWARDGDAAHRLAIPPNMYLPWPLNSRTNNKMHGGLHAAWLGGRYDPVIPEFHGRATRDAGNPSADGDQAILSHFDPHDGITKESTFRFSAASLPPRFTLDRFDRRRSLLAQLDAQRRATAGRLDTFDSLQQAAFDMVASPGVVTALDVTREPEEVRERYGYTLFGQGALAARRMIEAGVRIVTVFWDEFGPVNTAWDTHSNNFPRLKQGLCPTLDQVYPALLDDLQQRGLLEDTLVMCISEHGRTPTVSDKPGGGREHWSGAYWGLFAGAGVPQGQVVGATDKQGGFPVERPLNPKDILATVYHLLGFDPHKTVTPDRLGRPHHLLPHGDMVDELIA